jgi:hypothetical protein
MHLIVPAFLDRPGFGFGSGRRIYARHGEVLVDDILHGRSRGRLVPRHDPIHDRDPRMVLVDRDRPERVWNLGGHYEHVNRFDRVCQDGGYGRCYWE